MNNTSTRKVASYVQRGLRAESSVSNNDSVLSQLQLIHSQLLDKISQLEYLTSLDTESDKIPILEKVALLLQSQSDIVNNKINEIKKNTDDLLEKVHQVSKLNADNSNLHKIVDESKHLKSDIDSLATKTCRYDSSINSLSQQVSMLTSQVAQLKADLAITQSTVQNQQDNTKQFLTVGSKASLPEQPEPIMEAGVWKDAPLALVVSGGLALHNIGYTTKKGKALTYDPETDRLYIYNGK